MVYRKLKLSLMLALTATAIAGAVAGCGGGGEQETPSTTATAATATGTTATVAEKPAGIIVDPALQSVTGTPAPGEMAALINLQAQLPYPLIVPTYLPGGYQLDTTLMGFSGASASDPVGYYSLRYYVPGQDILNMTFNQSIANSKPLSGYYLTDVVVNGQPYQVYWHKTQEYLPAGDPVRTDSVGDAEGFVVVWQGQYTDGAGAAQTLHYAITTSTYTGIDWGTMQQIIAGLKPLAGVGG
ncbi:MAG: hypothetical protein ACYC5A_09260 [Thermoleophilia bacterium]